MSETNMYQSLLQPFAKRRDWNLWKNDCTPLNVDSVPIIDFKGNPAQTSQKRLENNIHYQNPTKNVLQPFADSVTQNVEKTFKHPLHIFPMCNESLRKRSWKRSYNAMVSKHLKSWLIKLPWSFSNVFQTKPTKNFSKTKTRGLLGYVLT